MVQMDCFRNVILPGTLLQAPPLSTPNLCWRTHRSCVSSWGAIIRLATQGKELVLRTGERSVRLRAVVPDMDLWLEVVAAHAGVPLGAVVLLRRC